MKRMLKKFTAILVTLTILTSTLLMMPLTASAASSPTEVEGYGLSVWADPQNVLSQTDIDSFNAGDTLATLGGIKPYSRSSSTDGGVGIIEGTRSYYWFFPSTADLSAMKFWFSTDSTVSIDDVAITSGEPTDVFADINEGGTTRTVSLKIDSTSYSVTAIKSGDVGAVYIDTASGSLSTINNSEDHSAWEAGSIMVVQPDGTVDYHGIMDKMNGRGNGTWSAGGSKNPYNIKLNKSTSLLGMGAAKKWCLLANAGDSTLIKNQLTYDFAKYIGIKYQPTCKPVDLYVNQQYIGSYQLSERVEIKTNRIDISDAFENLEIANGTTDATTGAIIPADLTGTSTTLSGASSSSATSSSTLNSASFADHTVGAKISSPSLTSPTDYTGGYLYELEISNRWVYENAGFCAYNRQGWVLKSCDYASTDMIDYSYDLLYALGSSVYNGGTVPSTSTTTNCSSLSTVSTYTYGARSITNPAPATQYQGKSWSDLLDADSAIRYYWTQEFFKNMDSSTSSTYFFKDSDAVDSKLYAGPMWDMDNSIGYDSSGSRWGYSYTSSDGWYTKNARIYRWRSQDSTTSYDSDTKSPLNFYAALATNCSDFWEMAEKYWYKYINPAVDILQGNATDETGVLKSTEYYVNTVAKSGAMNALRFDSSYDAASITSGINTWFSERQTWIDEQITKTDISSATIGTIYEQSYTGEEITPSPTVSIFISGTGTVTLDPEYDYTLSYENNIDAGTATITVTGFGQYTGSVSKTFKIAAAALSSNYTLSIEENAYSDMELTASLVRNSTGKENTSPVTYQWYRNGEAISGATNQSYTTTADDVGAVITVTATGDGANLTGTLTSNECNILTGTRPQGFTKTIAEWNYDYTIDSTTLETADPNGIDYYYLATGGENQSTSNLFASVNATDNAKVKWSGTADLYESTDTSVTPDQAPVMGTSKTDLLAWGTYPYFEAVVSTAGYENVKFSAKLGGTKKAPRDWKLQYSTDGTTYTDIEGATYSIVTNKTMELAFDNVELPEACYNQMTVYIRMVVCNDIAINGVNTIIDQLSGDAAINNVKVTGSSLSVVTSLYAPTIGPDTDSVIFSDDLVTITDNNGGADVYCSVNGGDAQLYTEAFSPFDAKTAKIGDTVNITAYSKFNDIVSESVASTFTFGGVDINSFSYDTFSTEVTNGAVASSGGVYGESGKMTAQTDGKVQYVPLWRDDNKSFCVSPDDGALWSETSGFTYKVSTAGYDNVSFTCKAYTTAQGPKSVTLQYSTDGTNFYNVQSNVALTANATLEQLFMTSSLPSACNDQRVLYIRLATTEDSTFDGSDLHDNASKGNLYVNDVVISGEDNGSFKMPYTNKSTCYFGASGVVQYISPDNMPMQYMVYDVNNNLVQNGTYPSTGIQLSTVQGFNETKQSPYKILIWVEEDEESSIVNTGTYYYKGDTITKFNYNDTTRLFANYVSSDFTTVSNTSGANSGTLSMYPNSTDKIALTYTNTYGVKVAWDTTNPFTATKDLNNPSGNGYWLIETSTAGFNNITLNLEQLSSNKGPRDWGIAYSTNGTSYTYVENSNARAISNDVSTDTVETYGNLALPSACNNQDKLYIKVFINGGESVDGTELELITKGNTGINGIELSGTPISATVNVKTTVLESKTATTGSIGFEGAKVYVNGTLRGTTDSNGDLALELAKGKAYTVTVKGSTVVERTVEIASAADEDINVPILVFDVTNDGIINAKDYAVINKDSKYDSSKQFFKNFINTDTSEFVYQ
ncbi:MAG: CotH kinase family protein [Eubacterium sp.]